MSGQQLTYAKAGVGIARGDRLVDAIAPLAKKTLRPEVVASIGGFAALGKISARYRNPLLVMSTDGVGTKVLLARQLGIYGSVGIDLVAMSVNDILTVGAEPLFFLDYFATGKLQIKQGKEIVSGVVQGCKLANCSLVGGETAEMPDVYKGGDFDLAGFCVGVVEKSRYVDGKNVRSGDVILGIPSSGLHSNGYSLVRTILKRRKVSKKLEKTLLTPTRIYVREVLKVLRKTPICAMAHITGGGLEGNVPRAFPKGLGAVIRRSSWKIPSLFTWLQREGRILDSEMFRTFNMGIGFVLVVRPKNVRSVQKVIQDVKIIGRIEKMRRPFQFR